MRKILLIAVVAVCLLTAGFAEEKSLRDGLREIKNVRDAEIVTLGDSAVVALKTMPLFRKCDFHALEAAVTLYLQENRADITNIYYSYDLDIFLKTAALAKKIENQSALEFKDEIFELIRVISVRKI